MKKENIRKLISYYHKSSLHDYETMLALFKSKRYSDSLFFGHIVLEKILKALVVKNKKKNPEHIHNLLILAEDAGAKLNDKEKDLLDDINRFNIRARYPDIKLKFYKLCTKDYTVKYLKEIKSFYQFLCQEIKQKK